MESCTIQNGWFMACILLLSFVASNSHIIPQDIKDPFDGGVPTCPQQTTNETFYFADPYDCSKYYQCSNGVPVHQSCPPGLEFSTEEKVCTFPIDANCEPFIPQYFYPIECNYGEILPDPFDCAAYIQCLENRLAVGIKCPIGLRFNPKINVCDWPENVPCNK